MSHPRSSSPPAALSVLLAQPTMGKPRSTLPVRRSRKFGAVRSPYCSSQSTSSTSSALSSSLSASSASVALADPASLTKLSRYSPYPAPTPTLLFSLLDSSSSTETEHLLSCTNTRYPGAPGTALFKAREAAAKQAQAARREADRKQRERDELARLGVGEKMGKRSREAAKRSESPYTNGVGPIARRSARADKTVVANGSSAAGNDAVGGQSHHHSSSSSSCSKAGSAARLVNPNTSTDPDLLSVTVTASTSSNGRVRRPASRGTSPVPLTASGSGVTSNGGSRNRKGLKSPDRQNATLPAGISSAPEAQTSTSSSSLTSMPSQNGHSNGSSIAHARLGPGASSTTQPFQSSPLARNSIEMLPSASTREGATGDEESKADSSMSSIPTSNPTFVATDKAKSDQTRDRGQEDAAPASPASTGGGVRSKTAAYNHANTSTSPSPYS